MPNVHYNQCHSRKESLSCTGHLASGITKRTSANSESTKKKPPTAPKEKKSGKGKQKTTELETISEADLTEAEQLKIITKRSRQETHSSHAIDDDQVDEQAQDDEDADKNDVNETTQDDEDDDDHDDDEKVQDDDEHTYMRQFKKE
ncbi:hypothetical protein Tco_0199761 [Tanacetum coccineum]